MKQFCGVGDLAWFVAKTMDLLKRCLAHKSREPNIPYAH